MCRQYKLVPVSLEAYNSLVCYGIRCSLIKKLRLKLYITLFLNALSHRAMWLATARKGSASMRLTTDKGKKRKKLGSRQAGTINKARLPHFASYPLFYKITISLIGMVATFGELSFFLRYFTELRFYLVWWSHTLC